MAGAKLTKEDIQRMMIEVPKTANENTKQLLDEKLPEQRSEKRSRLEKVTLYSKSNQ